MSNALTDTAGRNERCLRLQLEILVYPLEFAESVEESDRVRLARLTQQSAGVALAITRHHLSHLSLLEGVLLYILATARVRVFRLLVLHDTFLNGHFFVAHARNGSHGQALHVVIGVLHGHTSILPSAHLSLQFLESLVATDAAWSQRVYLLIWLMHGEGSFERGFTRVV